MAIEDTINSYEYKLKKAGLTEPLTTYLADPDDADRLAAGFPGKDSAVSSKSYSDRAVGVDKYWATPSPTDESAALQSAIAANPGKEIFFHQARHKFKTTIQVSTAGTTFVGVNGDT